MRTAASIALRTFTVAAGLSFAVLAAGAARGAGPVVGWGAGSVPNITASALAAGSYQTCAIQVGTGAVACWGKNNFGQAAPPPSVDGTGGTASVIAAGGEYTCAIQAGTGAVVCWAGTTSGRRRLLPPWTEPAAPRRRCRPAAYTA